MCDELGTNPILWDKKSPLPTPDWFKNEIKLFTKAVELVSNGNINDSIKILLKIKSADLRDWYCEHGQVSGRFRNKILKVTKPVKTNLKLDLLRSPDKYRKEIFKRDNFTCQYCGIKVVPKELLEEYSKCVGKENFCTSGTNLKRHGIVLAFRANADHILPWNQGGKTNPENLITCCWSCNYGKAGYTTKQLMLKNPKNNNFKNSNWNGLVEYIEKLKIIKNNKI